MFPLLGGLISGGASLLSGFMNSTTSASNTQAQLQAQQAMQQQSEAFNAAEAAKSRDFSAEQAGVQRDYETGMSNTAYQRASADMQKAGLNPMMMFGSGSAASSPAGAMGSSTAASTSTPSVPMPTRTAPLAALGDAVSKGLTSAINVQTVDKMAEEISNLKAERLKIAAETASEEKRPAEIAARTFNIDTDTAKRANEMPVSKLLGTSAQDVLKLPDWVRTSLNIGGWSGGKAANTLEPLTDLISSASKAKWLLSDRFHF